MLSLEYGFLNYGPQIRKSMNLEKHMPLFLLKCNSKLAFSSSTNGDNKPSIISSTCDLVISRNHRYFSNILQLLQRS